MRFIEKEFGIPKANQVILRAEDGKQLEPHMNLSDFLEKDHTIYIFNTNAEQGDVSCDDFEVICPPDLENYDWDEIGLRSFNELDEAYLNMKEKFELDAGLTNKYESMMAVFNDVRSEMNSIKKESMKLERQKESEFVVKKNLMGYYEDKKKKLDESFSQMKIKIDSFADLLENFEEQINKLAKIEIHPNLCERGKKYLIDYFDINKLRSNKIIYEKNQVKIKHKCQEMETEIMQYDEQLKKIEESIPKHHEEILQLVSEEEAKFNAIYKKILQTFHKLVESHGKIIAPVYFNNFLNFAWDANALKLESISQSLKQIKAQLESYLKDNAMRLRNFVSDVANIQLIIRGKLQNKHTVFRTLVEKHERDIFNLEVITEFPSVYHISMDEIQRRYQSKSECLTILNILQNFIHAENKKREEFFNKYSVYLPKYFCPTLAKSFPPINFDYLQKLVNQDESFLVDEDMVHVSKSHGSADVIKILKSFNNSIQAKELRIKELENSLKATQENLKKFEQHTKQNFDLIDIGSLLKKYGLEERFTGVMNKFDKECEAKMIKLNQRLDALNIEKIKNLHQVLRDIKSEILEGQAHDENTEGILERLREMKQGFKAELGQATENYNHLQAQLEDRDAKMKTIAEEIEEINTQKHELGAQVDRLDDEMKQMASQSKYAEYEITGLADQLRTKEDQVIELFQIMQEKERRIADLEAQVKEGEGLLEFTKESCNIGEKIISNCKTQIMNLWETLADKENQIAQLIKSNNELTAQLEEASKKNEYWLENDGRQNDQMDHLVGEFGDAIINMYISLFGKKAEESLKRDCFDLGEICMIMIDFIKSSMIKVDDLTLGDRVIGVKIPATKSHYHIIYRDAHINNILYTYQAPQDYGNVIIGTIKSLNAGEESPEMKELFKKYELNEVADVELVSVEKQELLVREN